MSGNLGRSNSDWRKDKTKSGGGIVIMQLSHHFDIIRYITGLEFLDVNVLSIFQIMIVLKLLQILFLN